MTVGTTQLAPGNGHNYIINGAFDFWQRGESFTDLTADAYTADRWLYSDSGATATITQEEFTPGDIEAIGFGDAKYFLRYNVTTGNANNSMIQKIEDVRTLAGQTVTLSFWAKADAEIDIDPYLVKTYGSGGSSAEAVGNGSTLTIGTTWQRFTKTITIGSNSGKTINDNSSLWINLLPSGSGTFTIDFWGVQLEAGSIATPFKRNANSIQGELAACQRYYYRIDENNAYIASGAYYTSTIFFGTLRFPVPMRVPPTLDSNDTGAVLNNGSNIALTELAGSNATTDSIRIDVTTSARTAGQGGIVRLSSSGTTFVEFNGAEL